jgi:hypothetical protein
MTGTIMFSRATLDGEDPLRVETRQFDLGAGMTGIGAMRPIGERVVDRIATGLSRQRRPGTPPIGR